MRLPPVLPLTLLLAACPGDDKAADDSSASGDSGDSGAPLAQPTAVIATVDTTYTVGALATVTVDGWTIADNLTTTSADPTVRATGGYIVQMNRGTDNNVRIYDPGSFSEPLVEFSTGDGSNPHDAVLCNGLLYVSLYSETYLGAYDPTTGNLMHQVDLSAFDDGDGMPEPSSLATIGDKLYVALQQLDENNGWIANGGVVAEVDCSTNAVTTSWEVGPSPDLYQSPAEPEKLVVRTGTYFDEAGDFAFEGGLSLLDPATGTNESFLAESDLSANITGFGATGAGKAIVLSTDETWEYQIRCLDLATGNLSPSESVPQYLGDLAMNERGEAWIAARTSWASTDPGGVIVYDANSCKSLTGDEWITLGLEPYSIAFY